MKREIELLAPGGDLDSIKAAIVAGANAVYCGLSSFNARNRATNLSFDELQGVLHLAHSHNCEVFLTLNIIILQSEISALVTLLNRLVNTSIDGIIVQDIGLFYLLSRHFRSLKVHASTQVTTHNAGQIAFMAGLNATRVNLSRELSIDEIAHLNGVAHEHGLLTEVFVHGSNCISFSGLCTMSSLHGGQSGNRGRCSQPCRDAYTTTAKGNSYPLNIKDTSAFFDLKALANAGVDSFKIEGRIKKFEYVYTVVDTWRRELQRFYGNQSLNNDNSGLYKVFNRDFTNDLLSGSITSDMFIDNPRDNSLIHLAETKNFTTAEAQENGVRAFYNEKEMRTKAIEQQITPLSTKRAPVSLTVSGEAGELLKVSISTGQHSFTIESSSVLVETAQQPLSKKILLTRFKSIAETEYSLKELDISGLKPNLFLPFREITVLKNELLYLLNDNRETVDPVVLPKIEHTAQQKKSAPPQLSILIDSEKDIPLHEASDIRVYFQLPNSLNIHCDEYVNLFKQNDFLIPWFPSVLIAEEYSQAIKLLERLNPRVIVTNNTGIGHEAYRLGIPWIAGPDIHCVNSYSLQCLKEQFNCVGAFVSNELNNRQISTLAKPDDFDLYFSIYHPIKLMTSRLCLFHPVTGCDKHVIDGTCISGCTKRSEITNLKEISFVLEKSKGNYHTVYSAHNYLNTDIVTELPDRFSGFMIDLRHKKTQTTVSVTQTDLVKAFTKALAGDAATITDLYRIIRPTTNIQYSKGI
ncbi:MAG: U32 family peptidase [Fibrobacterales bacterium]